MSLWGISNKNIFANNVRVQAFVCVLLSIYLSIYLAIEWMSLYVRVTYEISKNGQDIVGCFDEALATVYNHMKLCERVWMVNLLSIEAIFTFAFGMKATTTEKCNIGFLSPLFAFVNYLSCRTYEFITYDEVDIQPMHKFILDHAIWYYSIVIRMLDVFAWFYRKTHATWCLCLCVYIERTIILSVCCFLHSYFYDAYDKNFNDSTKKLNIKGMYIFNEDIFFGGRTMWSCWIVSAIYRKVLHNEDINHWSVAPQNI